MTDPFQEVRAREYPDPGDTIFLNAASYGLIPLSAAEASADLTLRRNRGDGFRDRELPLAMWRCRTAAAALIEAPVESVALAPNTSFGVNLAAHLAAQGPPGVIVLSQGEFPANVFPWMELQARGFRLKFVPTDAEGLVNEPLLQEAAQGTDVRAVALSAVQFHTGYRADLATLGTICREREVLFAVDGIQALGLDPLHPVELGIDVLATGGQKWLCSPWGSGFVHLSERVLSNAPPQLVSWLAYESTQKLEGLLTYEPGFLPDARRFELHTLGIQDYLGHALSLELIQGLGPAEIRRYLHFIHEPVIRWLGRTPGARLVTPEDPARRGGILAFRLEGPVGDEWQARAVERLRDAKVAFSVREGLIRLAPHFYNTEEQMNRVVAALEASLA